MCGKNTAPDAVHAAWDARKKEIDSGEASKATRARASHTIRLAAGEFYAWLDARVETGQPKPLRPATRADYVRYLTAFGRAVGADRLLVDIAPTDFSAHAKTFSGRAPSDLARAVAYTSAFFRWCVDEGLMPIMPQFGTYFRKPPQQTHRDRRIQQTKAYTPEEIQALWAKANDTEKLWIGLGLNGALDNADLSEFTKEIIDGGRLDYRRRKVGLARRVIPLRPEVLKLLGKYVRPAPASKADANRFFLTPNGHPLQREKPSAKRPGMSSHLDSVAQIWQRLLVKADIRKRPKEITASGTNKTRRRRVKFAGDADRRGFRSLRTTFANYCPPGYGEERAIIMGHLHGGVLVENYLEKLGETRLRELVNHVWVSVFTSPQPPGESK